RRCAGAEAERTRPLTKAPRKIRDMRAFGIHARNEVERDIEGAKHGGRQSGRIDEASAAVDEIVAQGFRAGDIAAEAAKRFREGADGDIGFARKPPPLLPEKRRC